MLQYQERVLEEKISLDEKISKLDAFCRGDVFVKLFANEQYRLIKQLEIMGQYSAILRERIAEFKGETK